MGKKAHPPVPTPSQVPLPSWTWLHLLNDRDMAVSFHQPLQTVLALQQLHQMIKTPARRNTLQKKKVPINQNIPNCIHNTSLVHKLLKNSHGSCSSKILWQNICTTWRLLATLILQLPLCRKIILLSSKYTFH